MKQDILEYRKISRDDGLAKELQGDIELPPWISDNNVQITLYFH